MGVHSLGKTNSNEYIINRSSAGRERKRKNVGGVMVLSDWMWLSESNSCAGQLCDREGCSNCCCGLSVRSLLVPADTMTDGGMMGTTEVVTMTMMNVVI